MKAFVFTCLLAVATASPYLSPYLSPLAYGLHSPLILSPVAPLVHYPSSGAIVPADAPDVAAAKIAHAHAHHEALSRGKRSASPAYYGPPAPLNSDGTVGFTPEVAAAHSYQSAAHAQEHRRLADAAALAAAHPDTTSPAGSYDNSGAYNQGAWNGNNGAYNQGAWNDNSGAYNQGSWNSAPQQWSGRSYNPAAAQPAPLNHDGTVAQTPEFQAIASAHAAAHQQLAAPSHHYGRRRRSVSLNHDGTVAPTPEVAAATAAHLAALNGARGYGAWNAAPAAAWNAAPAAAWNAAPAYAGAYPAYHAPAPLNHDGTVAETPEVAHLSAAHRAAQAQQLHALSAQAALAAAAGPGEGPYDSYDDGSYRASAYGASAYGAWNGAPSAYAGGYAQPAPLNHDGTVAHTHEYLAIAASHAAAHHRY